MQLHYIKIKIPTFTTKCFLNFIGADFPEIRLVYYMTLRYYIVLIIWHHKVTLY